MSCPVLLDCIGVGHVLSLGWKLSHHSPPPATSTWALALSWVEGHPSCKQSRCCCPSRPLHMADATTESKKVLRRKSLLWPFLRSAFVLSVQFIIQVNAQIPVCFHHHVHSMDVYWYRRSFCTCGSLSPALQFYCIDLQAVPLAPIHKALGQFSVLSVVPICLRQTVEELS